MNTNCFYGHIKSDFLRERYGDKDPKVEEIKGKASTYAMQLFNPDNPSCDISVGNMSFRNYFSQEKHGPGTTKGLATILGYVLALDKETHTELEKTTLKLLREAADVLSNPNGKNTIRKDSQSLEHFGGTYQALHRDLNLNSSAFFEATPFIHEKTGHLVVSFPKEVSQKIFDSYKEALTAPLTEEGKNNFRAYYAERGDVSMTVIASNNELNMEKTREWLETKPTIKAQTAKLYMVPVRGDYRFTYITGALLTKQPFEEARVELGLSKQYSDDRPPRICVGATTLPNTKATQALPELLKNNRIVNQLTPEQQKTLGL